MERKEIIELIKNKKKETLVKAFIKSKREIMFSNCKQFGSKSLYLIIGDFKNIKSTIDQYKDDIISFHIDIINRNSNIELLDYSKVNARIEPGAIIREYVTIKDNAIILMGAIVNIGASIGSNTMVDMNAVIGSNAQIGNDVHIGAGAVISGVLEPASKNPTIIEDNVFIGANAVILEGIKVSKGSIIGAGSIITKDVPPNVVVVGVPGRIIKSSSLVNEKTKNEEDLR